jgi:hypothetical protein
MAKYTRVDIITNPKRKVVDHAGFPDNKTLMVECWFRPEEASLTAQLIPPSGGTIDPTQNDQVPGHATITFSGLDLGIPYILNVTATVVDGSGATIGFDRNTRFIAKKQYPNSK